MKYRIWLIIAITLAALANTSFANNRRNNSLTEADSRSVELDFIIASDFLSAKKGAAFGIGISLFPTENFSIDYRFLFTSGSSNFYHYNAGTMAAYHYFQEIYEENNDHDQYQEENSADGWEYSPILLCLLPEGMTFHFPLNPTDELGLHINPFGYDLYENSRGVSFELGLSLSTRIVNKFNIKPYIGYKAAYNGEFHGLSAMISFGITI